MNISGKNVNGTRKVAKLTGDAAFRHCERQKRYRLTPAGRATEKRTKRKQAIRKRKLKVVAEAARKRNKKIMNEARSGGCTRCPEKDLCCLQFHHRDESQKRWGIRIMAERGMDLDLLLEEMAKCDVLCANCHFKEHALRRREGQHRKRKEPVQDNGHSEPELWDFAEKPES